MTWSLELLPRAEKEMAQAADWYEARRDGLGKRFLDEVEAMFERIAAGPARFPRWGDDARYQRAVLSRFPYVVMFLSDPLKLTVTVVAVVTRAGNRAIGNDPVLRVRVVAPELVADDLPRNALAAVSLGDGGFPLSGFFGGQLRIQARANASVLAFSGTPSRKLCR